VIGILLIQNYGIETIETDIEKLGEKEVFLGKYNCGYKNRTHDCEGAIFISSLTTSEEVAIKFFKDEYGVS